MGKRKRDLLPFNARPFIVLVIFIYQNTDETCGHRKIAKADLAHMFWSCSSLRGRWTSIFKILNGVFVLNLQLSPTVAI